MLQSINQLTRHPELDEGSQFTCHPELDEGNQLTQL
jgi:hypothetical protein